MRDQLAHRYRDTNHAVVQATVANDLGELEAAVTLLNQTSAHEDSALTRAPAARYAPPHADVALVLHQRYAVAMSLSVGLRELRQDASELVRRVERGEEIIITVAGRPSARLVPAGPARWHPWSDLDELFRGPADAEWEHDRQLVDDELRDRWNSA